MPWRDEVSPYRTLVSELMLQQTRVETVIPYFERFMRDFPTVEALAAAPAEAVLERWSGLGYYSRARNLQAAAQRIAEAGAFPSTVEGLRALPGVGPYTAGAVASIALGLDAPLVDGNVERVVCRQHAWAEDPKKIPARIWGTVEQDLPTGEAGDYNQALMELGATVCTPTRPKCLICPVRSSCEGVDAPERYPAPKERAVVPEAAAVAALVEVDGALLLARRPDQGLLGGLWEPPGGIGTDAVGMLQERVGVRVAGVEPVGDVVHVFSHLRLTTRVVRVTRPLSGLPGSLPPSTPPARGRRADPGARAFPGYVDVRLVPVADVPAMALSTLARKWLAAGG